MSARRTEPDCLAAGARRRAGVLSCALSPAALATLLAAGCASAPPAPVGETRRPGAVASTPAAPTVPGTAAPARSPAAAAPTAPATSAAMPARPAATGRRGGAFYLDDGPGDNPPPDLAAIPDAVPRSEPLHRFANRPYVVFGRSYVPMTVREPYRARGVATWYGRRYHGQKTSSGEVYDMYAMTGAHPTLPIPSFVRVTHAGNGRSVIVRINDRGPFIGERLIDLSYAAAFRLGYVEQGSATVEVEKLIPGVNWTPVDLPPVAATPTVPTREPAIAHAAPTGVEPVATALPPEVPPRAGSLAITAGAGGVFLQLGAFADRANAETLLARLLPELGADAARAHVHPARGLFRVHVGPYPDERSARAAAGALERALGIRPMVAVR